MTDIIPIPLAGHFNCSLIRHEGSWLLASRKGENLATIWLSVLGNDFSVIRSRQLRLQHRYCRAGAEDPRLFLYRDRLYLSFTGVDRTDPKRCTHQILASLTDAGEVMEVWAPHYAGRQPWEKNWMFFEHDEALYSVYSIQPHLILKHLAAHAERAYSTPGPMTRGEHWRGGASPVLAGEVFYHFFHTMRKTAGFYQYGMGVYTFAARPPFEVQRAGLLGIPVEPRPAGFPKSVIYPCGAVLDGDHWLISFGLHDRSCRIARIPVEEVEQVQDGCRHPVEHY